MDSLTQLMPLTPDQERSERVRARCRMQFERRARRRRPHVLAPAVVGGVCLLYTAALVFTTLRLEGVLQ
jgi:hypothetical protein